MRLWFEDEKKYFRCFMILRKKVLHYGGWQEMNLAKLPITSNILAQKTFEKRYRNKVKGSIIQDSFLDNQKQKSSWLLKYLACKLFSAIFTF